MSNIAPILYTYTLVYSNKKRIKLLWLWLSYVIVNLRGFHTQTVAPGGMHCNWLGSTLRAALDTVDFAVIRTGLARVVTITTAPDPPKNKRPTLELIPVTNWSVSSSLEERIAISLFVWTFEDTFDASAL